MQAEQVDTNLSPVTTKSLDEKLARIRIGKYRPTDFIIADAKDACVDAVLEPGKQWIKLPVAEPIE